MGQWVCNEGKCAFHSFALVWVGQCFGYSLHPHIQTSTDDGDTFFFSSPPHRWFFFLLLKPEQQWQQEEEEEKEEEPRRGGGGGRHPGDPHTHRDESEIETRRG